MTPPCLIPSTPGRWRCTLGVLASEVRADHSATVHCHCHLRPAETMPTSEVMAAEVRSRIMAEVHKRLVVSPQHRTLAEIETILDQRAANGLYGYDGCGCSGLDEFVTRLLYRDKEVRTKQ